GYSGPIKIVVDGLPAHTVVKGREIPPGASDALLELRAPINLRRAEVLTHVMGSATINGKTMQRLALAAETPATRNQPWLRSELALAVVESVPLAVDWETTGGSLP